MPGSSRLKSLSAMRWRRPFASQNSRFIRARTSAPGSRWPMQHPSLLLTCYLQPRPGALRHCDCPLPAAPPQTFATCSARALPCAMATRRFSMSEDVISVTVWHRCLRYRIRASCHGRAKHDRLLQRRVPRAYPHGDGRSDLCAALLRRLDR